MTWKQFKFQVYATFVLGWKIIAEAIAWILYIFPVHNESKNSKYKVNKKFFQNILHVLNVFSPSLFFPPVKLFSIIVGL